MGSSASAAQAGPGSGEARLLVVEDEPTILELLSGSLRFAGFAVLTAASGAEALRVAAASRPDLILLDVMLPDGDGFDVIRSIRSGGPRVPVIFLTARGHVRERVAGLTLGGDDYIAKPFSLEEVLARIRAVLRRAPGAGEAGGPAWPSRTWNSTRTATRYGAAAGWYPSRRRSSSCCGICC